MHVTRWHARACNRLAHKQRLLLTPVLVSVWRSAHRTAGATSGALTTPLDVLKTRLMTCTVDCAGGSVRNTLLTVFYTEGLMGLTSGMPQVFFRLIVLILLPTCRCAVVACCACCARSAAGLLSGRISKLTGPCCLQRALYIACGSAIFWTIFEQTVRAMKAMDQAAQEAEAKGRGANSRRLQGS